jgi:hypothetical protein
MKPPWKQTMRSLKLQYIKSISPNFYEASGGDRMKTKNYSDTSANGLTKCIVDFINYSGGSATRINTTGMMRKINGKYKWTHGTTRRGTADIFILFRGVHVSCELKIGRDKLSRYQIQEKARIEKAGGHYIVVGSMEEFLSFWNDTFNTQHE